MASNNLTLTTKFADEYKLTETLKQLQTRSKVNKTLDLIRLVTMGDRTAVSATCDCIYLFSKSTLLELVVDSFRKTAENEGIDGATRKIASIVLRSADRKNKYERRNFKIEVHEFIKASKNDPVTFTQMIKLSYPVIFEENKEKIKSVFNNISLKKSQAIKAKAEEFSSIVRSQV